jgi:sugar phosphate isomerase/epimerase
MNKYGYLLGLVSVSFRSNSPSQILSAMSEAGLSVIEWGSDVHAPCTDIEGLNKLAAMQKEYGIECSSYGTYFRLGETPINELENYINAAKILGTDVLRLWCGTKNGSEMTENEKNELLSICIEASRIAEKNNVKLCMECHRKSFTENPNDAVWLMKKVNSPHFRMYWQPFQWQNDTENVKNAEKIAPYAEHIHVFNWKGDDMLPLCDAVGEWREYLSKFSLPRVLLLEFMPKGSIEELKAEAQALRNIVGEVL